MSDILSIFIIILSIGFASETAIKVKNLQKAGITQITIDFKNGSICGLKPDGKEYPDTECRSLYKLSIEDEDKSEEKLSK